MSLKARRHKAHRRQQAAAPAAEIQKLYSWISAKDKARNLLLSILPSKERRRLEEDCFIRIGGKNGTYNISPYSQTEIYRKKRVSAYSCLQLSVPAPTYDRMIAEYLLIKNNEPLYWKTANVFPRHSIEFTEGLAMGVLVFISTLLLISGTAWLINHYH